MESSKTTAAARLRFRNVWAFVFLVLLNACTSTSSRQTTFSRYQSPITFTVTCSDPAAHFVGTITADGKTETVEGMGSGTYVSQGRKIHAQFQKKDPTGSLTLVAKDSLGAELTTSTPRPHGKVDAKFLRSGNHQYRILSSY